MDTFSIPIDDHQLAHLVSIALRRHQVTVTDVQSYPLRYTTFLPGRFLARLQGHAAVDGVWLSWSMIRKHFYHPHGDGNALDHNVARELRAYQSGLFDTLPEGFAAPRALGVTEHASAGTSLWLEAISDVYDRRWPLSRYAIAAQHLGRFNGMCLTTRPVPDWPWLNRNWINEEGEPGRLAAASQQLRHHLTAGCAGTQVPATIVEHAPTLLQDQTAFRTALEGMPETLCHHDASQANLFARDVTEGLEETVAVDWESVGPGAVGADLATLVVGTMRRGIIPAARADTLDELVFAAYVAGLRDVGWDGSNEQVRLGYTAAIALRWSLVTATVRLLVDDAYGMQLTNQWQQPRSVLEGQWVPLSIFLLERAAEARALATQQ